MKNETIERQPFDVSVPKVSGDGIERFITIQIPMEWDAEISEWLMTEDGSRMVEETKCQAIFPFISKVNPSEGVCINYWYLKALSMPLNLARARIGPAF